MCADERLVDEPLVVAVGRVRLDVAVTVVRLADQCAPRCGPSSGVSDNTARRARTSSLRFVSCVEVASMRQRPVLRVPSVLRAWNVSTSRPNVGFPADLVERRAAGSTDRTRCPLAFGHHRAGELLEAPDRLPPRRSPSSAPSRSGAGGRGGPASRSVRRGRAVDRTLDERSIARSARARPARRCGRPLRAHDLRQRIPQLIAGEVAPTPVAFAHPHERWRQPLEVGVERLARTRSGADQADLARTSTRRSEAPA